jgi:hypothetical protein
MFCRERGNKVELLRPVYDSVVKRCKDKVIASFDRYGVTEIPKKARELINDEEAAQVQTWLTKRKNASDAIRTKYKVRGAARDILEIAAAIEEIGVDAENVQTIFDALKRLKKALKATGHTPVSLEKKPSKQIEGQTALFGDETGIKAAI